MKHFSTASLASILLFGACSSGLSEPATGGTTFETYPGFTGLYEGFTLVIDERFDQFDSTVWRRGDGAVGTESACRFQDQGVLVEDGKLKLIVRQEAVPASYSHDHQKEKRAYDYSCGELRTIDERKFHYGRLEARMRAPDRDKASGYISSLFTFRFESDPTSDIPHEIEWEEIDVELEGGRPDKFQANLIYGMDAESWLETRRYGAWEDKIETAPVDEWRVFAIEWLPDSIRWYVDGELVKTLRASDIDCDSECVPPQERPTPIPNNPTTIMMNTWIPNDEIQDHFGGNKASNEYPLIAQYDWFRYYEWDGSNASSD
ncbi:MAG: family 16 glycosylhydrolase [Henriciella sp.]|nr:family 16 glycosylhydrolase [Henriciella sp.]